MVWTSASTDLDACLASNFSDDYWSGEGISQAHRHLREFTEADWASLKASGPMRDEKWQCRLANILPFGEPEPALEILVAMAETAHREAHIAALDSMREMDLWRLHAGQRECIQESVRQLQHNSGRLESMVLRDLLSKLGG